MTTSQHGAKIGTRLSGLIARTTIAVHKGLLSTKHALAMLVFRSISDEISAEVDHTLGPIFQSLTSALEDEHPAKALMSFMAYDHGQLKALAGSSAVSQSLMWPISQILNNVLAPIVYLAVENDPRQVLDPGTMATLAATGRFPVGEALTNIRKQGFDTPFGDPLIDASRTYPSIAESTQMLNRQLIDATQFTAWALKNGIPPDVSALFIDLANQPISPADAALALLRNNMSRADALKVSADWGIDPASFDILLGNTGEPPGLMQLLEAFRRGFIDEDTLKTGILQSRVRDEWIPTLIKLRYSPMSVADAVNATVQNHLSADEAASIADQNGLEPGAISTLLETAGQPLSRTEMEQLYNRGLVTSADVIQAMRESRLKDKYTEDALKLHVRLLEPRMLADAVMYGSITHDEAITQAMDYGYPKELAAVLVDSGSKRKLQALRTQNVTAILDLFETNAITEQQVESVLRADGYDDTEIQTAIKTANFKREYKLVSTLITAIRSRFLMRHIEEKEATELLIGSGVPASQIDYIVKLWSVERMANTKMLSEAQIVKAVKLQLITPPEGLSRLENMGYSEADAVLLLEEI